MNCTECGSPPKGSDRHLLPAPYFICSACMNAKSRKHYNQSVKQAQDMSAQGLDAETISEKLDVCKEQIIYWITKK